jgi:dienelactone hydrolase
MCRRLGSHRASFACAALLAAALVFAAQRPLTHADYDSWRSIASTHLSPDGRFLAYALFPQEGDGEVVIRNLSSNADIRVPAGARPPAPPPDYSNPEADEREPRGITLHFTSDSRFAVFSTFPAKADVDRARKSKKKAGETPRGGLSVVDLGSGSVFSAARIRSFQVPEKGGAVVAYLAEPPAKPDADESKAGNEAKKEEAGSVLTLRSLPAGSERKFEGVTEYSFAKDGRTLVFADTAGLEALSLPGESAPETVLPGKGKHVKIAWDEGQKLCVFLSNRDESGAKQPRFKLYAWDRTANPAIELVGASTAGMPAGYAPNENGNISFSRDGSRVFFGSAPPAVPVSSAGPGEERAVFDLWHWRDDFIPPMRKVRAAAERRRTYRAVFHLSERKLVQLAGPDMAEAAPSLDGRWAIGRDDRAYRSVSEYSERFADFYLVNTMTGERSRALEKHAGNVTLSPDGRYALFFNGRDWLAMPSSGGGVVNLTAGLHVNFFNEEDDRPQIPSSYGLAGWTNDGQVAVYDAYDVWVLAPKGGLARNATAGAGRRGHLRLRYVKLDPEEKSIDPAKPALLRSENTETHDTGFFNAKLGETASPRQLILEARNLGTPIRAKSADVLALTASNFSESPDLWVTDSGFHGLRRVTSANPQKEQLAWGTAELLRFRNTDGVPLAAALYKPENFDASRKYPLLIYIYERLSGNVHQFVEPRPGHSINISYYVSNGYLVLTPDIVYTVGHPGQSALKCVLPAVQAVVDRGYVDEKAIGIQGHSWGGYQIAYMITQTSRFRAASAGAPVANMVSAYDGIRWGPGIPRQFQYEKQQSRIGGSLWQYPERFLENSPILQADRVTTPVLMIHNDADDAVPWYQGIEYFLALRRLEKEAYLFNYNGEPHGLRKRANQKDYTLRLQQFFDHYLKGAPKPEWMEHGIPSEKK